MLSEATTAAANREYITKRQRKTGQGPSYIVRHASGQHEWGVFHVPLDPGVGQDGHTHNPN